MLGTKPEESEIGLELFLSDHPGVGGKLRHQPEDFIVNEVTALPLADPLGKNTLAVVTARNWESNRLIRRFSKELHISRRLIGFAGTKDKRAVSTQLMSFGAAPEKLDQLAVKDVWVSPLYTVQHKLRIGDLIGNHFRINLREFDCPLSEVAHRVGGIVGQLRDAGGFINYFGVQRFGIIRPITHLVGKCFIDNDFSKAADYYIGTPMPIEDEGTQEARRMFERREDPEEILQLYPGKLNFERSMLHHLRKHPGDYVGAFARLPHNLLLMFIHAYQSYLFNRIVSGRLKAGLPLAEPRLGDLVVPINRYGVPKHKRWFEVTKWNQSKIGTMIGEGKAYISAIVFGSTVDYAKGEHGEIERRVIAKEGLERDDFNLQRMRHLSSTGIRREIHGPMRGLNWWLEDDTLTLEFGLNKGNYATCLFREIMKAPIIDY